MSIGSLLSKAFEKVPEWPIKNDLRYFLAFNPLVPSGVSDLSPVKGYELHYQLKEGDVVVDAGAFTGDYTVFASRRVGPKGKVIAFEPDEKNRRILKRNLQKERTQNVIIVPKGLWNEDTELSFDCSHGLQSSITTGATGPKVSVATLDNELHRLGISKIDVLKMDIEGAEIQAIEGSRETLKANPVHVIIASYHLVAGKRTSFFIENFLQEIGYEAISDFPKHLTTYGWKP
jgi:FkbM family methyltransferase